MRLPRARLENLGRKDITTRVGILGNPDPENPEFQPIFTNLDLGIICSKIPRLQVFQNHHNVWLVVISFA